MIGVLFSWGAPQEGWGVNKKKKLKYFLLQAWYSEENGFYSYLSKELVIQLYQGLSTQWKTPWIIKFSNTFNQPHEFHKNHPYRHKNGYLNQL